MSPPTQPSAAELQDVSLCAQRLWDLDAGRLQNGSDYDINVGVSEWVVIGSPSFWHCHVSPVEGSSAGSMDSGAARACHAGAVKAAMQAAWTWTLGTGVGAAQKRFCSHAPALMAGRQEVVREPRCCCRQAVCHGVPGHLGQANVQEAVRPHGQLLSRNGCRRSADDDGGPAWARTRTRLRSTCVAGTIPARRAAGVGLRPPTPPPTPPPRPGRSARR